MIKAEIQLKIIRQRPARVSVVGEVTRPGVYYLSAATNGTQEYINPSILNAIQKAWRNYIKWKFKRYLSN